MYRETTFRSVLKTITWRLWATAITILLVWLFTKKLELAFSIGALELTSKLIAYFIHERIWDKVNIGRQEINSPVITTEEQFGPAEAE
jgi:adenylylsulfate kinase